MGMPLLPPPTAQKLVVQSREEPRFDFGSIAKLVSLGRPKVKRLLGQVACLRLVLRQTQCKPVQRFVKGIHDLLEGLFRHISKRHLWTPYSRGGQSPWQRCSRTESELDLTCPSFPAVS